MLQPRLYNHNPVGNFGFKNKAGEFVIEPQYAFAHEFTCGLAAVNLNRTWYKTEEGRRFYENHFGYIDDHGKTIIPFDYDEAWPYNKYGVAVVETLDDVFLINTTGKTISGTPIDSKHFHTIIQVSPSEQFLGWIIGLGSGVKAIEPEAVVLAMKDQINRLSTQYP